MEKINIVGIYSGKNYTRMKKSVYIFLYYVKPGYTYMMYLFGERERELRTLKVKTREK